MSAASTRSDNKAQVLTVLHFHNAFFMADYEPAAFSVQAESFFSLSL
jgi:hypothetical protein